MNEKTRNIITEAHHHYALLWDDLSAKLSDLEAAEWDAIHYAEREDLPESEWAAADDKVDRAQRERKDCEDAMDAIAQLLGNLEHAMDNLIVLKCLNH